MSTKVIAGFGDIAHAYDALIVDLWGVTHNGRTLYPDAVAAFDMAKAAGKQIIFLSNAPRRANNVFGQLDTYGLDRALYDDVVTSGEAAWDWIRSQAGKEALGGRCYHLGAGEKDANMRVGLDVEFVDDVTTATFILNTGPEDAVTTLAGFQPLLVQAQAASVPMVCAIPISASSAARLKNYVLAPSPRPMRPWAAWFIGSASHGRRSMIDAWTNWQGSSQAASSVLAIACEQILAVPTVRSWTVCWLPRAYAVPTY